MRFVDEDVVDAEFVEDQAVVFLLEHVRWKYACCKCWNAYVNFRGTSTSVV